jgi:PRTRC genetic system protein B
MKDFELTNVLKIYSSEGKSYIEIHNVKTDDNGNNTLGEGRPLSKKAIKKMINYISESSENYKPQFSTLLMNKYILSIESNINHFHLVWYSPEKIYDVLFTKDAGCKSGKYKLPAFLYVVVDDVIKVFTMKTGNRRPVLQTELFNAPIMNTIHDNKMCWGSVDTEFKSKQIDKIIDNIESSMWNSYFAHEGNENSVDGNIIEIYNSIYGGEKPFPKKRMVTTGFTLEQILKQVRK